MKNAFITTKDKDIYNKLLKLGFQEISSPIIDTYMFINNTNLVFSNDIDLNKIKYTNKICF